MAKKTIPKKPAKENPLETKPETGVLKTKLISAQAAKELMKFPYACKIEIDEPEIKIRECEKEIELIEELRVKLCLVEKWQKARDQYAGVTDPDKDFPWEDSSNLFIHITSMAVDILNTKAQAQMFVSPMMLLKPIPGQTGSDLYTDILLKEKFLDNKIQEEIELEEKLDPVLQDAINIGTGIAKVSYLRKIDYDATVSEIYESTPEDIRRFKKDFEKDKDTEVYRSYLNDLIGTKNKGTEEDPIGIPVEVWMQSDEIVYDNPEISYVKLDDLLVRPDIPDLNNQRVIAENITFTWLELCNHVEQGYFHNKQILNDLREKYQDEYYKKIYKAREVITYHDYEKTNRPKRVVITYLTDEKWLLRAITFPYMHRQPYYVPYYIKRVPGNFYGEGLAERLEHTNKALNTLWNQTIDSGTLRNAPAFKAVKGANFDPSVKRWGPAVIWWVGAVNEVEAFQSYGGGISAEMLNIISRLERYGEWQTGVSAYATGRESPSDPNAPASKAYMLLKESNLRLNKMIKQLHKSNKQLIMMIDKLIYQHTKRDKLPIVVMKGESIEMNPISKKILGMKVNYIPQLSDITANKELQKEQDMKFGDYLMPKLQNVPAAQREILQIQIRNMGGAWEKAMDKLLPPEATKEIPPVGAGNIPVAGAGASVPGAI